MAKIGKPDVTGRSSGKVNGRKGKAMGPPKGEPWAWQTKKLLLSPSWRALSLRGRLLIEFLTIEHMNHGGQENGRLAAPYDDLQKAGISRKNIPATIFEVCELGLVSVTEKGGRNKPSRFELCTLPVAGRLHMSNPWKTIGAEQAWAIAQMVVDLHKKARGPRDGFQPSNGAPYGGTPQASPGGTIEATTPIRRKGIELVAPGGTALISSRKGASECLPADTADHGDRPRRSIKEVIKIAGADGIANCTPINDDVDRKASNVACSDDLPLTGGPSNVEREQPSAVPSLADVRIACFPLTITAAQRQLRPA